MLVYANRNIPLLWNLFQNGTTNNFRYKDYFDANLSLCMIWAEIRLSLRSMELYKCLSNVFGLIKKTVFAVA